MSNTTGLPTRRAALGALAGASTLAAGITAAVPASAIDLDAPWPASTSDASGAPPTPGISMEEAFFLCLREARVAYAEGRRRQAEVEGSLPPQFREGPKFRGYLENPKKPTTSFWPAIANPPLSPFVDLRPSPDDLIKILGEQGVAEEDEDLLNHALPFVEAVEAFGERLRAQLAARAAAGLNEIREAIEAAYDSRTEAENAIYLLPCQTPNQIALVALVRWSDEHMGIGQGKVPDENLAYWVGLLGALRSSLSGAIAEAVDVAIAAGSPGAPFGEA